MSSENLSFNFTRLIPYTKSTFGFYGVIAWDSHTMELLAMTEELLKQVCVDAGIPLGFSHFELRRIEGELHSVAAAPRVTGGTSHVSVKWPNAGRTVRVDLLPLLAVITFNIPRDTKAFVPVERREIPGLGPVLVLHFGKAEFRPVVRGRRGRRTQPDLAALAQVAAASDPGPG